LTFTREDGSTFTVGGAQILCQTPSKTNTPGQLINVYGGLPQDPGPDGYPTRPTFTVEALVDDVADGATLSLPDSGGSEGSTLSAYDPGEK